MIGSLQCFLRCDQMNYFTALVMALVPSVKVGESKERHFARRSFIAVIRMTDSGQMLPRMMLMRRVMSDTFTLPSLFTSP